MSKQIGQILDERLQTVNAKLRRFGVPFDLPRLGNYKEGEWEISDVLSVSWFRNFIIQVVFLVREPKTGREIEHQGLFNHTYSDEAKSGHIIVPVFRFGERRYFAMHYAYGLFVGRWSLLFPRGFIPAELVGAPATAIAKAIFDRKVGSVLVEHNAHYDIDKEKFELLPGAVAENHTVTGNLLTFSVMTYEVPGSADQFIVNRRQGIEFVLAEEFPSLVRDGKIADLHTLTAYAYWQAHCTCA